MYKLIIYDFDGTLADTLGPTVRAYDAALQHFNIYLSRDEIVRTCFGKTEEEICATLHIPAVEEFRSYYFNGAKAFEKNCMFPFVKEMLQKNKTQGLKQSVITFGQRWYIDKMLAQLGLTDYFDLVISQDDVENAKPAPEAVIKACKLLNIDMSEVINIGDSKADIEMGKAAGITTVLFYPEINKLYYDLNELKELNPDYIINSHLELEDILE